MTAEPGDIVSNDTVGTVKDASSGAASAGRGAAQTLAESAREAAASVSETAGAAFERARDGASAMRETLPGTAGEALEAGRRTYAHSSKRLGRHVARQPVEALLLAGAIGYLVGWAANRS